MGKLETALVVLLTVFMPSSSWSSAGPSPPCGGASPLPSYPPLDAPPNAKVWSGDEVAQGRWRPPTCIGWESSEGATIVALAGRFQFDGGIDGMLKRLGAISQLESMRYWSVTESKWRNLISQANAVFATPTGFEPRDDFSIAEMRRAKELYFYQDDTRAASGAVYLIKTREIGQKRIIMEIENVTAVKLLLFTLFPPGALQAIYFLDYISRKEGIWAYYSLTRSVVGSHLLGGQEASFLNRAIALYRHIGKIPISD